MFSDVLFCSQNGLDDVGTHVDENKLPTPMGSLAWKVVSEQKNEAYQQEKDEEANSWNRIFVGFSVEDVGQAN